jgi:glycosyltransferase involved in cell wall biosynthesis
MPATPERIRIALDGTPLAGPPGGIARFTKELFQALPAAWPDAEFVLLSDQLGKRPQGLDRRWWAIGLAREIRRQKVSLFHGTDFAVPYWKVCPSVMTMHDLSPWSEPSALNARVRQRTNWLLRLRIPDRIHTPSEAVREETARGFGWQKERIEAIPLAAAAHLRPTSVRAWPRPYVLYLGALEERKNLSVVVAACEELWRSGSDFDLLLAGKARANFRVPAGRRICAMGEAPEADLPSLYSGALLTVYPSRYEGFGLPVLEAMQCGCPVVASDLAVLRETGGSAALYAAPGDVAQWIERMTYLLENPEQRKARAELGLAHARNFTWQRTALAMRRLYEQCLR